MQTAKQYISISRWTKRLPTGLLAIALCSCVSYKHPHGEWAEPVDLNLNSTSASGLQVKLSCVVSNRAGVIDDGDNTSELEPCATIGSALTDLGATVDQGKPQILVQYKRQQETSSSPTLINIACYFSFTLIPCASVNISHASLVIQSIATSETTEWPLEIHETVYGGIGALVMMLIDYSKDPTPSDYERQLSFNFTKYIRNRVYSQSRRLAGVLNKNDINGLTTP